jgi:3-deoxy-manno-octulosonate cytidylyltransferase (CMP-KDO synthetase)
MIQHVYERAARASLLSSVIVATDDERIRDTVESFGGTAMMTAQEHASGTDRVAEVAGKLGEAHYVNIQGDEPLIDPHYVDTCARLLIDGNGMSTLATRIRWRHELFDQNIAKVVLDHEGYAIYFSRSPIPFPRKYLDRGVDVDLDSSLYLRHVGVYGFSADALEAMTSRGESELDSLEGLEMLRAIYLGIRIKVGIVEAGMPHVDLPEDIRAVEEMLKNKDGT